MIARSSRDRSSRRAASSAWIVGGTAAVARSPEAAQRVVVEVHEALVDEHRDELRDEQRVALGRGDDPGLDGRLDGAVEQHLDEPLGLGRLEGGHRDDRHARAGRPLRPLLGEQRSGPCPR